MNWSVFHPFCYVQSGLNEIWRAETDAVPDQPPQPATDDDAPPSTPMQLEQERRRGGRSATGCDAAALLDESNRRADWTVSIYREASG